MRSILASMAAAVCMAFGAMPAMAGEGDGPRSSYVDDYGTVVPLQLAGGTPATVRRVFLNVGGKVQTASPDSGVERQDQNRLDWSRIPLVGQLAEDRHNEADFAPENSIGDAYFADGTIWLDLSDDPAGRRYPRIEFLNQDSAYRLKMPPAPAPAQALPSGPPGELIGHVFRGDDGALLVLVRPFVVTDSLF